MRCREGSTILLRLCAALEAFDIAIDTDQSSLDIEPRWPIIEEEAEYDRQAAEDAAAAEASAHARASHEGSSTPATPQEEGSWFRQQQQRQQQEQREERREGGGWAASALSEIDQV